MNLHESQVLSSATLDWFERTLTKYDIAGAGVSVVKFDGEWKCQNWTHGIRNAKGEPWTPQSILPIHSATKMVTGLAIGTLIHRDEPQTPTGKKLSWSTKIKDIWPDFETRDTFLTEHGDIDDFLGMRSGIAGHGLLRLQNENPATAYKAIKGHKLGAEPRQYWQYYTNGMNMCSEIVPRCTGVPYPEYLAKLLKDIGMQNAHVGFEKKIRGNTVDGHVRFGDQGIGKPVPIGWWCDALGPWNQGSGGLMLSVEDVSHLLWELLEPKIIPAAVTARILTAHGISHPAPAAIGFSHTNLFSYAMGTCRATYRSSDCLGHSGSLDGHGCQFLVVPSKKVALFVSINDDSRLGPVRAEAVYRIMDDLLGERTILPEVNPSMEKLISLPRYDPPVTLEHHLDVSGNYHDDVYGDLNILPIDFAQPSPMTTAVKQAFRWTTHASTVRFGKWFYAPLPGRAFVTHVFFEHREERLFNVYVTIIRHVHNKADEPTEQLVGSLMGKFSALFLGDGFGMFGGWISGARSTAPVRSIEGINEQNIAAEAEVYYRRNRAEE